MEFYTLILPAYNTDKYESCNAAATRHRPSMLFISMQWKLLLTEYFSRSLFVGWFDFNWNQYPNLLLTFDQNNREKKNEWSGITIYVLWPKAKNR